MPMPEGLSAEIDAEQLSIELVDPVVRQLHKNGEDASHTSGRFFERPFHALCDRVTPPWICHRLTHRFLGSRVLPSRLVVRRSWDTMDIRVEEINLSNQHHLNQFDFGLTVDKVLDLTATDPGETLHFIPVAPYEKLSRPDMYDVPAYIGSKDRAIFFAFADDNLAGQIILKRHWNHHAWVEEFVVDRARRRRGIGRALMDRARDWAYSSGFPAIMVESQNNRAAACCFYHDYGFKIGGYDRYVYYGTNSRPDEIAVFWYYFLREWKAAVGSPPL